MSKILCYQLKHIDSIEDYVKVDKLKEQKERIEEFKKKNPFIKKTIKGEIDIKEEFKKVIAPYKGIKTYAPFSVKKQDIPKIEQMQEIVGDLGLNKYLTNILNPTAIGGGFLVCIGGIQALGSRKEYKTNRREFFKNLIKGSISYGLVGGAIGLMGPLFIDNDYETSLKNAEYVQYKIKELYKLENKAIE